MDSKYAQRQYCLMQRQGLTAEERKNFSIEICKKISSLDIFKHSKTILSYMPSYDEVDPSYLFDASKVFAYPVCLSDGIMKAYAPNTENNFEIGKYGIKSPKLSASRLIEPKDIDLVVVPCVGFDENLNRLGHGKGYYDRFLRNFERFQIISIAFELQKLDNTHVDSWDIPMSMVITEKNIYV